MSSKITKKRLKLCKDKATLLYNNLSDKKAQCDVTEFLNTIKFAMFVADEFIKTKDKERPAVPDEGAKIEQVLKEYEEILSQLADSGKFFRFFTSTRVRKRLDQLNATLYKEIAIIWAPILAKKKSTKGKKDDSESYLECIVDPDGRELWGSSFGNAIMAEFRSLMDALSRVVPVDEESMKLFQYILDNSNSGYVSIFKFSDFLTGFGPLKQCVTKVNSILKADWFHGFLSSLEAERLLEKQNSGTYLIRFSKSRPGSFAIAYVDSNNHAAPVTHTLITSCPPSGFKIEEQYHQNARGRLFVSIAEVVEFYGYILQAPFRSDLSKQSWFHGDLSSEEANEILKTEKEGTFLFRFSSKPGFLAVSYVNSGQVKHGLLETLSGGYKFDNNPPLYPTLQDVVYNLKDLLKIPYTGLTFEVGKKVNLIGTVTRGTAPNVNALSADSNYASFSNVMKAAQNQPTVGSPSSVGLPAKVSPALSRNALANSNSSNGVNPMEYKGLPGRPTAAPAKPATIPPRAANGNPMSGSEGPDAYGAMPGPSTTASNGANPFQYGKMPGQNGVPSNGTNGTPLSPGNRPNASAMQYGKMPDPQPSPYMAIGSDGTASNVPGYGKMPGHVPGNSSATEPSQYGSIQMATGKPTMGAPIMGNASANQYGKMPNPMGSDSMLSGSPMTAPLSNGRPNASVGQYGSLSAIGAAPSLNRPLSMTGSPSSSSGSLPISGMTSTSTPTTSGPNSSNYMRIPVGLNGQPMLNQVNQPNHVPSQYGSIQLGKQNSNEHLPPQQNYGKLSLVPGAQLSGTPPPPTANYGRLSAVNAMPPPPLQSNNSQYGSIQLVRTNVNPQVNKTPSNENLGEYNHLPLRQSQNDDADSYAALQSHGVDDYAALTPFQNSSGEDFATPDEYGSLQPIQDNVVDPDAYGALPPVNAEEYGALPSVNLANLKESDYGALPDTSAKMPGVFLRESGNNGRENRMSTHRINFN